MYIYSEFFICLYDYKIKIVYQNRMKHEKYIRNVIHSYFVKHTRKDSLRKIGVTVNQKTIAGRGNKQ